MQSTLVTWQALAVHWGTFVLTERHRDQPKDPKVKSRARQHRHGVAGALHVFRTAETRRPQD